MLLRFRRGGTTSASLPLSLLLLALGRIYFHQCATTTDPSSPGHRPPGLIVSRQSHEEAKDGCSVVSARLHAGVGRKLRSVLFLTLVDYELYPRERPPHASLELNVLLLHGIRRS